MTKQIVWTCKIGNLSGLDPRETMNGADLPMRIAVQRAYKELTGKDCEFCFSGWGAILTQPELNVVLDK